MRIFKLTSFATVILLFFIAITGCQNDPETLLNVVPTANAGPNQTITLPVDNVTLTGTGTDPDGEVKAYLWSQVSGPASSLITNEGNATATVKFNTSGTYIFQLMVTDDDGATGVDTAQVKVNPAAEQTLTLQPANNPFDFTLAVRNGVNISSHSSADIPIEAWTIGGDPLYVRSLMKFDLSTIPQNATIVSANLYLYSFPPPTPNGNFTDPNFGTNNSMTLQRVTSDWTPASTTWANQPPASTQNQVVIPHTASITLDLNLNVTPLVSTMVANSSNYGFLIKLQNEVIYTSRIFVSSWNTTHPDKRPKLVVVYR
jgi:hypothetical protein